MIYHSKTVEINYDIKEIRIWKVPTVTDKPHGLKYSFVYIQGGKRIIGYDNSEGKGDHRHVRGKEGPYKFKNLDKLWKDFHKDIENLLEGKL